MTKIYETNTNIRRVSKKSKSLILPIPPSVRDLMGYHHKSKIKIEIHIEDKKKYIVIK
jgi:hypothetical protein